MSSSRVVVHGYKWTHPVCGHEHVLTSDPHLDLAVPDSLLEELDLPQPGMPMDMFASRCHPANMKYLAEKNPFLKQLPKSEEYGPPSANGYQYGAFNIKVHPDDLPMGSMHPDMNRGKDIDPHSAILAGFYFGSERGGPADSDVDLGWPGHHLECPTCLRERAHATFDQMKGELLQAGSSDAWSKKTRELADHLMMMNRSKAPMPITLAPVRHPADPPIIRGPKADEIARAEALRIGQLPPPPAQHDFAGAGQFASPERRMLLTGFPDPGSSSAAPGSMTVSSGLLGSSQLSSPLATAKPSQGPLGSSRRASSSAATGFSPGLGGSSTSAASVPRSFPLAVGVDSLVDNSITTVTGVRSARASKAIPIVDPSTRQSLATPTPTGDMFGPMASTPTPLVSRRAPAGRHRGASTPVPLASGPRVAALDIARANDNFVSANRFGVLDDDDTESNPDTPGGVRL